jgi:hypothetical protein
MENGKYKMYDLRRIIIVVMLATLEILYDPEFNGDTIEGKKERLSVAMSGIPKITVGILGRLLFDVRLPKASA